MNLYSNQQCEQVSFAVTRTYRDQQGQYVRNTSWPTHDIPILLFLLSKAQRL